MYEAPQTLRQMRSWLQHLGVSSIEASCETSIYKQAWVPWGLQELAVCSLGTSKLHRHRELQLMLLTLLRGFRTLQTFQFCKSSFQKPKLFKLLLLLPQCRQLGLLLACTSALYMGRQASKGELRQNEAATSPAAKSSACLPCPLRAFQAVLQQACDMF